MPLDDYDQQFLDAGQRWNVDPRLLKTMADIESSGRPGASNRSSGAAGLMGFMPGTAKQYGVNPLDAGSSIDGGAHYMHDLLTQYGGNVDAALHHYSGRTPGYAQQVATRYGTFTLPAEPPPTPAEPGVKNFQTPARVPNTFSDEGKFPAWAQAPPNAAPAQSRPTAPQPPEQPMAGNTDDPTLRAILDDKAAHAADRPAAAADPDLQGILAGSAVMPGAAPARTGPAAPGAFAAMMDPGLGTPAAPLFGIPALQSAGAGLVQGFRDIDLFADRADKYLADRFPLYRTLDQSIMGYEPGSRTPGLEASTKAYEQQHGDTWTGPAGRFVGNVAPTLPLGGPAAAFGGAARAIPAAGRVLAPILEGGTMGAAGNLLTSQGKTPEEWGSDALQGFGIGGALGGVLGGGKALLTRGARPADQEIADRLGVRLSTGQASGGPLKSLEDVTSYMPGSGAEKFAGQQRQQIANVISREAGMPQGVPITSTTLDAAQGRIGTAIDNAAANITVPATPQLQAELTRIANAARQAGHSTEQADTMRSITNQLSAISRNNGGVIPGDQFQKLIARGGPLDTAIRASKGEVREVGNGVREALLDAAATNGTGTQQALAELQQARYQYKVTKTVERAINRTAGGSEEMSLPGLAQSIGREFSMGQTGAGHEMADLAKLINGPLRELKSSGTGRQIFWQKILSGELGLGGTVGGGAFMAGLPLAHSIATGIGAPLAVGTLAGRGLRYGLPGGNALLNRQLPTAGANLLTDRPPP